MMKVFVTGGNAGIGLALCRQLVIDHNCHVFLGSRNAEKGAEAVKGIMDAADGRGAVELITIDVSDDGSVRSAAQDLKSKLKEGELLDGIVNNAGIGLQHGTPEEIMSVNFLGPKRVMDSFGILLRNDGRVVNVGSGAGPSYVKNCPPEAQKLLCNDPESWEQIVSWGVKSKDNLTGLGSSADGMGGYGLSKALLSSYTRLLAKETKWQVSCCTPGFIDTKLTAGWGAKKTPDEGTLAIKKCLFEPLEGMGWYYGSDGVRSPYHFMRNPGEPAYDGTPPY